MTQFHASPDPDFVVYMTEDSNRVKVHWTLHGVCQDLNCPADHSRMEKAPAHEVFEVRTEDAGRQLQVYAGNGEDETVFTIDPVSGYVSINPKYLPDSELRAFWEGIIERAIKAAAVQERGECARVIDEVEPDSLYGWAVLKEAQDRIRTRGEQR